MDRTACVPCPAGRYMHNEYCTLCPAGKLQNQTGQHTCVDCPSKTQISAPNRTFCAEVPSGRFMNTATGAVQDCPAGKYKATAYTSAPCKDCGNGQYTRVSGSTTCQLCGINEYTASNDSSVCIACPSGKYTTPDYQRVSANAQLAASVNQSFSTLGSAKGNCSVNINCYGYLQSANASVFVLVSISESSSIAKTGGDWLLFQQVLQNGVQNRAGAYPGCYLCPGGTERQGTLECTQCKLGQYMDTHYQNCRPCALGQFTTSTGASSCQSCPAGKSINAANGTSACADCAAGKYASVSGTACKDCPAGQYAGQSGQMSCAVCNVNEFSAPSSSNCTECPSGNYTEGTGSSACKDCPLGKHIMLTGPGCVSCPAGKQRSALDAVDCALCAAGEGSPEGQACNNCTAGQYSKNQICTSCVAGEFTGSPGQSACQKCPAGKFQFTSPVQRIGCEDCPVGRYGTDLGASSETSCKQCGAGQTTTSMGASNASQCSSSCSSAVSPQVFDNASSTTVEVGKVYQLQNVTNNTSIRSTGVYLVETGECGHALDGRISQGSSLVTFGGTPKAYFTAIPQRVGGRRLAETRVTVNYATDCYYGPWQKNTPCLPCYNETQMANNETTYQNVSYFMFSRPAFGPNTSCAAHKTELWFCPNKNKHCPVPCSLSSWGQFHNCSLSCGSGKTFRTRDVLREPKYGGKKCDSTFDTKSCNTAPCPVDCKFEYDYTACSKTCGEGTRLQTLKIIEDPRYGGRACPDASAAAGDTVKCLGGMCVTTTPCFVTACPGSLHRDTHMVSAAAVCVLVAAVVAVGMLFRRPARYSPVPVDV